MYFFKCLFPSKRMFYSYGDVNIAQRASHFDQYKVFQNWGVSEVFVIVQHLLLNETSGSKVIPKNLGYSHHLPKNVGFCFKGFDLSWLGFHLKNFQDLQGIFSGVSMFQRTSNDDNYSRYYWSYVATTPTCNCFQVHVQFVLSHKNRSVYSNSSLCFRNFICHRTCIKALQIL